MKFYLEPIIAAKQEAMRMLELELSVQTENPLHRVLSQDHAPHDRFSSALKKEGLSIIAEIKGASPSLGLIRDIPDPVALALMYEHAGAAAISVLTDSTGFGGSLEDLAQVSNASTVPSLCKDFIIHPLQLAQAKLAGASAVLLIVKVLGSRLSTFMREARRLGLETLTEVHDRADLEIALEAQAPIMGINHRDLSTFEIDMNISAQVLPLIPAGIITVAESGIRHAEQALYLKDLGFDALLVGEALMRSPDPAAKIRELRGV